MSEKRAYVCGDVALVIFHPTTGSDAPLEPEEEFVVALATERDTLKAIVDKLSGLVKAELTRAILCTANPTPEDSNILCRKCWTQGPIPDELIGHTWQTVPHNQSCRWGEITKVLAEIGSTQAAAQAASAAKEQDNDD